MGTEVYRGTESAAKRTGLVQGLCPRIFEDVDSATDSVRGIDQTFLVDNRVIDLDGMRWISRRSGRDEEPDLPDLRRRVGNRNVHQTIDANPGVEQCSDERVLEQQRGGTGKVGMQIVGAEPASAGTELPGIFRE